MNTSEHSSGPEIGSPEWLEDLSNQFILEGLRKAAQRIRQATAANDAESRCTPEPAKPSMYAIWEIQEIRFAWEEGFKLCRSYGDNHAHFSGEQKERMWAKFLESRRNVSLPIKHLVPDAANVTPEDSKCALRIMTMVVENLGTVKTSIQAISEMLNSTDLHEMVALEVSRGRTEQASSSEGRWRSQADVTQQLFDNARQDLRAFRLAERSLSDAYLRLRKMIPGAMDTGHAPTAEEVWKHTEEALSRSLRLDATQAGRSGAWLRLQGLAMLCQISDSMVTHHDPAQLSKDLGELLLAPTRDSVTELLDELERAVTGYHWNSDFGFERALMKSNEEIERDYVRSLVPVLVAVKKVRELGLHRTKETQS